MENNEYQGAVGLQSRVNDDYNVIRIRLDASDIIERIETYLRGYKIIQYETKEGDDGQEVIKFSNPKMNNEGIGTVLNWISGTINAQVVQGNFPIDKHGFSEKYEEYIYEYNVGLLTMIVTNCVDWDMDDSEIEPFVDFVMMIIIPFMSRLIGNEERKSYSETIRSMETQNIHTKGNAMGNIFKR